MLSQPWSQEEDERCVEPSWKSTNPQVYENDTNDTLPGQMFLSLEIILFVSMEKLQLWAGPRSPAVQGSGQRAGMSGSLGRARSWSEHLDALTKKAKVVVFPKGMPEQPQCSFSNALLQIL
ncbi:unnamed protein product [Rangifer tarandus platyrhynchus]